MSDKLREICILGGGKITNFALHVIENIQYYQYLYDKYKIKITKIGTICKSGFSYRIHGKNYIPKVSGYDHFQS